VSQAIVTQHALEQLRVVLVDDTDDIRLLVRVVRRGPLIGISHRRSAA
jgi:hypothetical protein